MEQSLIERVCTWSKYAYNADVILEEMADDIRSSFESRMQFRTYKSALADIIYDHGLPEDVKKEYDLYTSLLISGELTPEMKQKRKNIQARVSRLLGKLEMAVYGSAIDIDSLI